MGLLEGLLGARKLLLAILVPLLLLPLPMLHPSSVSTSRPLPGPVGQLGGRWREEGGSVQRSACSSVGVKKWKCFPGGGSHAFCPKTAIFNPQSPQPYDPQLGGR